MADIIPTQFVLYDNDAVDASYSDGSMLQVSPCGASFVWLCGPEDELHPLNEDRRIQQRTQFVTSRFKSILFDALNFRNRFSERTYICPRLVNPTSTKSLPHEIYEATWKAEYETPDVKVLRDGGKRLESLDGYAVVTLAPCRQYLTVDHLARLSESISNSKTRPPGHGLKDQSAADYTRASTAGYLSTIPACSYMSDRFMYSNTQQSTLLDSGDDVDNHGLLTSDLVDNDEISQGRCIAQNESSIHLMYVWTTKHYSVTDCPSAWSHPMHILLKHDHRVVKMIEQTVDGVCESKTNPDKIKVYSNESFRPTVASIITPSLPLDCISQHVHKFKTKVGDPEDFQGHGNIKVVCSQGVIFKAMQYPQQAIEIYPGDGSIMRSTGIAGHYFDHYYMQDRKIEDKTYSIRHPPPKVVGEKYNIANIITKGARLLELIQTSTLQLGDYDKECCWKVLNKKSIVEPMSSELLEEYTYPGLGRFKAYSSGRVRILFDDRTALDMNADFSERINNCMSHSGECGHECKQFRPVPIKDIPHGMCRLFLPNGKYNFLSVDNPAGYDKYIQSATEWVSWVNTSPSDRHLFYKDTIHDPDKLASITKELTRINCFNYLLDQRILKDKIFCEQVGSESGDYQSQSAENCAESLPASLQPMSANIRDHNSHKEHSNQDSGTNQIQMKLDINPSKTNVYVDSLNYDMVKMVLMKNSQAVQEIDDILNQK